MWTAAPTYYLSLPFGPFTGDSDVSFSLNFRVVALDDRVLPTAFLGLMTTQHVAMGGNGLTLVLSSSNGLPMASAAVDQGSVNSGGESIMLTQFTDYLAVGRFASGTHQFTLDVYSGSNFVNLVGSSTAWATNRPATNMFSVDRLGLQNAGGKLFDQTNGSITVVVDNLFLPAHPPAFLSVQDTTVTEGDIGYATAVFPVTLSTPLAQTTRVDYATHDLTATSGRDYLSTNGTLVFLPGITRQDIQVKIPGDLLAEPTKTFQVTLTNPFNANLGRAQALETLLDNDVCLISVQGVGVIEPLSGTIQAQFAVSLSTSNEQPVWVIGVTERLEI